MTKKCVSSTAMFDASHIQYVIMSSPALHPAADGLDKVEDQSQWSVPTPSTQDDVPCLGLYIDW